MTTAVFSIAPALHGSAAFVGLIDDISPAIAVSRLERAGVLAAIGDDSSSIVLLGFNAEVSSLLRDLCRYGTAHSPRSRFTLGKLARLQEKP